jgi:hypothetical protein
MAPFQIALATVCLLLNLDAFRAHVMAFRVLFFAVRTDGTVAVRATELDLIYIQLTAMRTFLVPITEPPGHYCGCCRRLAARHFGSLAMNDGNSTGQPVTMFPTRREMVKDGCVFPDRGN